MYHAGFSRTLRKGGASMSVGMNESDLLIDTLSQDHRRYDGIVIA